MTVAYQTFQKYVTDQGLNRSSKRDRIVRTFLKAKRHVSLEDLHRLVQKEHPDIGYTTVYRTLKLLVDSGIAETVHFNDGVPRYEEKMGREFHAHFICNRCGKSFELFDPKIKELNFKLARKKGFIPQSQRFEIFGECTACD